MRLPAIPLACLLVPVLAAGEPLPIDPLWQSETFRKSVTASYGIDSRIEPRITEDEAFYLDQAAVAMAAKDRPKAIAALRGSSLLENSPAMRFTLASLLFETGEAKDADDAVTHFEAALNQFPNFRDAHRNLAVVLVQKEKFDKAKEHLIKALALGAQDGLTAGLLGYCHARDGHHQASLDAYRLAMLTQPEERQWKLGVAQALLALKQSREAASILQSLLETTPGETSTWLILADASIELGEELRAASYLEIVHRAGQLDASATASLGHLYLQHGLPDLALERFDIALRKEPHLPPSRAVEIVEVFLSNSDWTRAKKVSEWIGASRFYAGAFSPEEGDKELLSRLTRARAVLELEAGDTAAGAKLVEEWLSREPMDGECLLLLARFRESDGKRVEAEMLLEQAARVPATAASAHLEHGRLLVAGADYEQALAHLEKSQELRPSESLANYLRAIRELTAAGDR